METLYIKITDAVKQADEIKTAAALLKKGEVVAIPTETVYGLAADTFNVCAIKKIFEAKGRPQDNPLIVHIAEINELYDLASEVPQCALELAKKYWPGPLTIILPKKACIPSEVSAGLNTVAIRMPSHPVAAAVIRAAGVPLAAPSANISGFPSPTEAQYVCDDMNGRIAAVIDGGSCDFGIESTVISLAGKKPVLLRPGAVTLPMLTQVLGEVEVNKAVLAPLEEGATAASPGMKYKHYSPKARISVVKGSFDEFLRYINNHMSEADYCMCFEGEQEKIMLPSITFGYENDSLSQAKRLFDALRELDAAGAKNVFCRAPSTLGVGLGVCNRLYRAAGFCFLSDKQKNGKIIGLTGGTGSGKSTVAERFKKDGAKIIDCDALAAKITEKGSPVLTSLAAAFGEDIILPDGALNRKKLALRAFENNEKTKLLNSITHPQIIKFCIEKAKEYTKNGYTTVLDAPLLFTSGLNSYCYKTVTVYAPENERIARVINRDGISEAEAKRRIAAQQTEAELSLGADFIFNNYSPYNFEEEYKKLVDFLK